MGPSSQDVDEHARSSQLSRVREYCAKHPHAVLFDETGHTLFDVAGTRTLPLKASELTRVEDRVNRATGQPYLVLVYGDGHELALSDAGIAFVPDTRNTGPLPELPAVVCLRDFHTVVGRVKHALYDHPDLPPDRDALGALMVCIAILDGARGAGFDVAREERELEGHLSELERRSKGGA